MHAFNLVLNASFIFSSVCKDMVPPKDPYIKVRVLDDIGSVALSDQIANLARHAILFLRRTDAETYISQVFCFLKFCINAHDEFIGVLTKSILAMMNRV